jgi:hypothetical protein
MSLSARQENTAACQHLHQFHQITKVKLLVLCWARRQLKQPTSPIHATNRSICGLHAQAQLSSLLQSVFIWCEMFRLQLKALTDDEQLSASRLNVNRLYY